jgi:hypothetical protein
LDEVASRLPGQVSDKVDEARIGFAGPADARTGLFRGVEHQTEVRCGCLPLPCHDGIILPGRSSACRMEDGSEFLHCKKEILLKSVCCVAPWRPAS